MSDSEVHRELRQLSRDLAKGLSAVRFMVEANTARIKKLERLGAEGKLAALEERLRVLDDLRDVPARLLAIETQMDGLKETDREQTGKIRTLEIGDARGHKELEKSRIRWGAVVSIGVAVMSGVGSLVIQLIRMLAGQ